MITDDNRKDLEDKGFTVVPNVLSKEECDNAISEYRGWLTKFGDDFPLSSNSVIWDYNAGHMEVTWRLRLQAKPVFAQIWNTEKLLTSFDAIAIGRPPEEGKESFEDVNKHWLHVDTTPSRIGLHAYQGALYLEEQTADDWTFQVMEKSHKYLDEFFVKFPEKADFVRKSFYFDLSAEDVEYFKSIGCTITRVAVPKGGMALWDSRLVHANARPILGRKNSGRWRFVTFISMTPAIWANEEDIRKHQEAYKIPVATSHWSSQGLIFGEGNLEACGGPNSPFTTTLPDIARTDEALKLSAMIPYDFNDGKPNGGDFIPVWRRPHSVNLSPEEDQEMQNANGHI